MDIGERHSGTLRGQLVERHACVEVDVVVEVETGAAHRPDVQHAAWMLVNLLGRLAGVVRRVDVVAPPDVLLAGRIVPFTVEQSSLLDAIRAGLREVRGGDEPTGTGRAVRVLVGPGPAPTRGDACLRVHGSGWCGGVSQAGIEDWGVSALPVGPYIAACLAAGEIFSQVRIPGDAREVSLVTYYSGYTQSVSTSPIVAGPSRIEDVDASCVLAGVGAVGSACLHTLWACEGLAGTIAMYDDDDKGIELSNLNRYVWFGRGDVGLPKASTAVLRMQGSPLLCLPHDRSFDQSGRDAPLVISAVDRNDSREHIQYQYPGILLGASTHDLRSEVLACGPPGDGACLRCYNPPEREATDDEVRAKIGALSSDEQLRLAERTGISIQQVQELAHRPKCGEIESRLLKAAREGRREPRFAVGFVSVLAGTLLAASILRLASGEEPVAAGGNRAVFQFWSPHAFTNRPDFFSRDVHCPCCREKDACDLWRARADAARSRWRR